MGFLTDGTALPWEDAKEFLNYVRQHGILQFLSIYHERKDSENDRLLWGDEIEFMMVKMDRQTRRATLALCGANALEDLTKPEKEYQQALKAGSPDTDLVQPEALWRPEYANYMAEATPGVPYTEDLESLDLVEKNMSNRRRQLFEWLRSRGGEQWHDVYPLTLTAWFRMGVGHFTTPGYDPEGASGEISKSDFVSDHIIFPHQRFRTLTANIRLRRTAKVDIRAPVHPHGQSKFHQELAVGRRRLLERKPGRLGSEDGEEDTEETTEGTSAKDAFTPTACFLPQYYKPKVCETLLERSVEAARLQGIEEEAMGKVEEHVEESNVGSSSANGGEDSSVDGRPCSLCGRRELQTFCPDSVKMDCMAFGMGCCCLQVTFQLKDIVQARFVYDQFIVLCPIMLALTAATPILKGKLIDMDVRWFVVSGSVDDRTPEELALHEDGHPRVPKSRYESCSCYLSEPHEANGFVDVDKFNDIRLEKDPKFYQQLLDSGVDRLLAKHVAHLFIRDPLVIYSNRIELDDTKDMDHFENIQSTNWQTVRFKPPPHNSSIGWRTEFRVMELQLTDWENAAFTCFVVLVTRAIQSFQLNMYMPLSKVDYNMGTAHKRDAVLHRKFHWRKNICDPQDETVTSYTINEIINGCPEFEGLKAVVNKYLDVKSASGLDPQIRAKLDSYVDFVSRRASGELITTAAYLRNFVLSHPSYEHDAVVNEEIAFDLTQECIEITFEGKRPMELFGPFAGTSTKETGFFEEDGDFDWA